eukprot:3724282-Rhodomonas_salina.3
MAYQARSWHTVSAVHTAYGQHVGPMNTGPTGYERYSTWVFHAEHGVHVLEPELVARVSLGERLLRQHVQHRVQLLHTRPLPDHPLALPSPRQPLLVPRVLHLR